MKDTIKQSYPTLIIVFVIAFLLGYGTSARFVNRAGSGAEYAAGEGEKAEAGKEAESALAQISASADLGINAVSADDQPAGSIAAVAVKAGGDVWVAVHEDTGGKPGSILGAQLFTKGTSTGTIDLLRRMMAGRKYYVILHADDGDQQFDHVKDLLLMSSAGGAISDEFTATDAVIGQ